MIEKIAKKYNLSFPKNDIVSYKKYPKYNFIYNKLELFKFQNIKCNPLPINPDTYPVVVKPIINLMGMGMDAKKINNQDEFNKLKSLNGFFWCKFLRGKHNSWDLIINKGNIVYYVVFEGVKFRDENKFGLFNYWKNVDININNYKIINMLIKEKFGNFTGHINLETIGKKIIEAHLRLGDIDFCHDDIILLALLNINNKCIEEQLNVVKNNNYNKLYLYPVWMKLNNNNLNSIYKYIEDNIEDEIINEEKFRGYYFDKIDHPNPSNYKRWLLLIGYEQDFLKIKSIEYKKRIDKFIKVS